MSGAARWCGRCTAESRGMHSSACCICGPNVPCEWCGQGMRATVRSGSCCVNVGTEDCTCDRPTGVVWVGPSLTDFLRQRIAEDEARLDCGINSHDGATHSASLTSLTCECDFRDKRETEAKRRIVALHGRSHECSTYDPNGDVDNCTWCLDASDCSTMRSLASIYANHADYQREWKP